MGKVDSVNKEKKENNFFHHTSSHQYSMPGVSFTNIKEIPTEGGPVLHMLKAGDPNFSCFGEIYFSVVEKGAVKAWKRHKQQTQLFVVPHGLISIVLYDDRDNSHAKGSVASYLLGRPDHYSLLRIPPLVWYGFSSQCNGEAILANFTDMPHDPNESERLPATSSFIPFSWNK